MKKRIVFSIFFTAALTLALASVFAVHQLHGQFVAETNRELLASAATLARAVSRHPETLADTAGVSRNRLTLIAPDGAVLFDNEANPATMGNHKDRPEVAMALRDGQGHASRLSGTLSRRTHYFAVRLDDGRILRVAAVLKSPLGAATSTIPGLFVILLAAFCVAYLAAELLTRRIMRPINALNLDDPLSNNAAYDELSPLLRRLSEQQKRIAVQFDQLETRRREVAAITENMAEGLLFLGADRHVVFANRSAEVLFEMPGGALGKHFLELAREPEWQGAVEGAFNGRPGTARLHRHGRLYEFSAAPAGGADLRDGAIVFAMDITEKASAEAMRREFSANVSHELKTPLTSIMGYAEIMENGLVKPEDVSRFAGKIRSDSARLLAMIENILILSHLDENDLRARFEDVDLAEVCREVRAALEKKARDLGVVFEVSGGPAVVRGLRQALFEMVFNLCDNAISYNRPGGRASVRVEGIPPVLTVEDTGVGIAKEHQARVFERFYRADKGRSRACAGGGSGLGLAIAKHVAQLHGAKISLASEVGRGTSLCVTWPEETEAPLSR